MELLAAIGLALALDSLLGEPKRYHPLVFFGSWVDRIEARLNRGDERRLKGVMAWALLALVPAFGVFLVDSLFQDSTWLSVLWSALVLYLAIGWTSLIQHAQAVQMPLNQGDIEAARSAVSHMVSRDTAALDEAGIARGATESVLENGADAIFAALFWFVLLGAPGVALYRLANTLDAMWGYKNERFVDFGWCAARCDDVLNLLPAQLTALTYSLLGNREQAFDCWRRQGLNWKSINAGSVMAAGAGAVNVSLGGDEYYHGALQSRSVLGPELNDSTRASAAGLGAACLLVNRSLALWCVAIIFLVLFWQAG